MGMDYQAFLKSKAHPDAMLGFSPNFIPDWLFGFQLHLVEWAIRKGRCALYEDCGLGKGQPEGSLILTPTGFVQNTELQIGDLVIGSDGRAYPLKAKYNRGVQPTFRVYFSDGVDFVVDAAHLHIVRTNNDRQRGKPWRVISTRDLLDSPLRYGSSGKSRNFDIPVVQPVRWMRREHWIHPYILGVLLGDGCITRQCHVSLDDPQIVETVQLFLPDDWTLRRKPSGRRYDYSLSKGGKNDRDFIKELRRLRLLGKNSQTKFIPEEYLLDSVDNRLWLLRGLMDTDGYAGNGTSQFYSISKKLASGAAHLIRSLGGVPTVRVKNTTYRYQGKRKTGQPCHVLTFSLKTFNPFHLARKAVKWNPNPRDNGRWIDRIEPCGRQRTICLSVGSPDQSYVTEHFIVTHNTPQQLVWAENMVCKTNMPVLILAPLAVSAQFVREGEKFDIKINRTRNGEVHKGINVTNYEQMDKLNPRDFGAISADESSVIKHHDSKTRKRVVEFFSKIEYRLLCTATPAPNDYMELGSSAEALGVMTKSRMLGTFFTHDAEDTQQWSLKGHAAKRFWKWVCTWARAIRKPSDLGFSDDGFILPKLTVNRHELTRPWTGGGFAQLLGARTLTEQRREKKRSTQERCEKVAELVRRNGGTSVVWCQHNDEGDLLEELIPGAVQVAGADSDKIKEDRFVAFAEGAFPVLVTKPKIGGWGLNWQHCNHMTWFISHSFEAWYQAIRRCWRFGQKRPVTVDIVLSQGERRVVANLSRKERQAEAMFSSLVASMAEYQNPKRHQENGQMAMQLPGWLS